MFRQRLKGGRKAGTDLNSAASFFQNAPSSSSPVVPEYTDQSGFSVNNPTLEVAWNWDSPVSESSHENEQTSQPPMSFPSSMSDRPNLSHEKLSTIGARFQNGENTEITEGGTHDEWSWGNDWGDWGSNETSNPNSYNQPFPKNNQQFQPSYSHKNVNKSQGNNLKHFQPHDSDSNKTIPLPSAQRLFLNQDNPIAVSNNEEFNINSSDKEFIKPVSASNNTKVHENNNNNTHLSNPTEVNEDSSSMQETIILTQKPDDHTYIERGKNSDLLSSINNNFLSNNDNTQVTSMLQGFIPQRGNNFDLFSDKDSNHQMDSNLNVLAKSQLQFDEQISEATIQDNLSPSERIFAPDAHTTKHPKSTQDNYHQSEQEINWETGWQNWEEEKLFNTPFESMEKQQPMEGSRSISRCQTQNEMEKSNFEVCSDKSQEIKAISDARYDENKVEEPIIPTVASWDDGWGDGWEIKPQDSVSGMEISNVDNEVSTVFSHHSEEFQISPDASTNKLFTEETRGSISKDLNEDLGIEVANIEVLDQELQGIFSAPSEASLVVNSDIKENLQNLELVENISLKGSQPEACVSQNIIGSQHGYLNKNSTLFNDNFPLTDDGNKDKASSLENTSLRNCEEKYVNENPASTVLAATEEPSFESTSKNIKEIYHAEGPLPPSQSEMVSPNYEPSSLQNLDQSKRLQTTQNSLSHSYQLFTNEPVISQSPSDRKVSINESEISSKYENNNFEIISRSNSNSIPNLNNPTSGPSGYIPSLHARKGSPFQPPVTRKSSTTSSQSAEMPDPRIQMNNEIQQENAQSFVNIEGNEVGAKTSILSNLHIPDHNVKLCVAAQPAEPTSQSKTAENIALNKVPLSLPALSQYDREITQSTEMPYLHNSIQPVSVPVNSAVIDSFSSSVASMSLADTSNGIAKREVDKDPPSFSRMVPGESTKGESSNLPFYQAPSVVPSMPSGRVVTGNANPQPLSSVRVKQEPSVIRAPPDGPDSVATLNQNEGVIPPVRSETIGSEDHAVRPIPPDRREAKEDIRDREGDREYFQERYRERKRQDDEYYRDESPPRGMRMRERDYDLHYEERRHRSHEDDDDKRISDGMKERRRRAYQDELERYGGDRERDRDFRREKRRHRNREHHYDPDDEDPYFESRHSDRSRPTSRSSSYGNLESESGQRSYFSHNDDYYEHVPKGREREHTSYREYPRYKKRDRDRDRDRDPYGRPHHGYPDHYGSREMYDPQSYYYYYQNYQKYLEQNPYYREYYRQYYGRYGYGAPPAENLVDDKASTRSGRSSVNDEMKKSSVSSMAPYNPYGAYYGHPPASDMSSQFRQEFFEQSSVNYESSSLFPEHGTYPYKSHGSGDISGVPSVTDEGESDLQPHRVTPELFTGPHLSASFTSGGKLLLVLPNDPKDGEKAVVQVRNVQKMLAVDSQYSARLSNYKNYPGPLTLKDTHKDTVLRFCESKAQEAMKSANLFDKESVVLMWEYLSLLVKQNGNVCGADLANLLTKGRTFNSSTSGSSDQNFEDEVNEGEEVVPTNDGNLLNNRLSLKTSHKDHHSDLINKFTDYLCLGRKKEAVDYAIREGLWGYAMTLAAKMDSVTHARVMSAFIHSIPNTDVLQTLIQHLSGKKPEVSKYYNAEKWGDWRQHLAMIVSNPTGNVQRDRASMIALGDTLASKNRIHAAHICYLAAEGEWGTFSSKDSKLVLIGSSPSQAFQLFANDEAIQCTEIFEFAKSLDVNSPLLCSFQSYKLIYGLRLAECGFPNESLKYCEVISEAVMKKPNMFQKDFVAQVFELASQLKYHDVHYQMGQGEVTEMPDPEWLQNLQHILYTMQYQAEEALKFAATVPEKEEISSRPSTAAGYSEVKRSSQTPDSMNCPPSGHPSLPIQTYTPDLANETDGFYSHSKTGSFEDKPMTPEINHNHRKHSTPINSSNISQASGSGVPMQPTFNDSQPQNPVIQQQQQQLSSWQSMDQSSQQQQQSSHWQSTDQTHQQQQAWQQSQYDQQLQYQPESNQQQHINHQQQPHQSPQYLQQQQQPHLQHTEENFYHNQTEQSLQTPPVLQHAEMNANHSNSHHWQDDGQANLNSTEVNGREVAANAYGSDQTNSNLTKTKEEEEYWAMMSGKDKPSPDVTDGSQPKEEEKSESVEKKEDKNDDKKSSFLGSLFGGWRKGTNQAKLPDDKDPSIVWDEKKKKWVNKDGEDEDNAPPPPPPSALSGAPPPNLRGGIKKSRYVDPVGEKGRMKPAITTLPTPLSPFPSASPIAPQPELPSDNSQQEPPSEMPQHQAKENKDMIKRHRFASECSSVDIDDDHDIGSGLNQVSSAAGSIPMMAPGETQPQPMFFNPAQFRPPNSSSNPVSQPRRPGPGRRAFNPQ